MIIFGDTANNNQRNKRRTHPKPPYAKMEHTLKSNSQPISSPELHASSPKKPSPKTTQEKQFPHCTQNPHNTHKPNPQNESQTSLKAVFLKL
jgi:hypothetical protein